MVETIAVAALRSVLLRVRQAAERSGRESNKVRVVAVSKTKPVSLIRKVYDAGHRCFGENYVQEIVDKAPQLPDDVEWHFVGHLQSNKVKSLLACQQGIPQLDPAFEFGFQSQIMIDSSSAENSGESSGWSDEMKPFAYPLMVFDYEACHQGIPQ